MKHWWRSAATSARWRKHLFPRSCAARDLIDNAGEMNGYLKPKARLLSNPLPFLGGNLIIPAGYYPEMDRAAVERHTVRVERFAPTVV